MYAGYHMFADLALCKSIKGSTVISICTEQLTSHYYGSTQMKTFKHETTECRDFSVAPVVMKR